MKTIFGFKLPSKKVLTVDDFKSAAKECGYAELMGQKLYEALAVYAGDTSKLTQAFLKKIPDDQIEIIKGIKAVGHKILNHMKTK